MKLFRMLLHLYPVDFRMRYATEMVQLFELQLEEARTYGPFVVARLWLGSVPLLVFRALIERMGAQGGMRDDLTHAVRHTTRHKLASTALVATLALAVGTTTAAFSIVREVLLQPLPYAAPDRLALL